MADMCEQMQCLGTQHLVAFLSYLRRSHKIPLAHACRTELSAATQEEIANIRQQSRETLVIQTAEIQQQISKRLNDEFKTEAIRQTVQAAAKQQTAGALMPIITTEVKSQVAAGVKSEQQDVQRTMLQQMHQSVEDLKPTINKRVDDTVGQAVNTAVSAQVDSQMSVAALSHPDGKRFVPAGDTESRSPPVPARTKDRR
jgi:hypothetical protein